jgi:hypothetical protein
MAEFCAANHLSTPAITQVPGDRWRFGRTCAYYREDVITICLAQTASPGYGGMAWSWPGYVIDRTPYGVIQHELGHHVDFTISDQKGAYGGDFSSKLRTLTREERLTNYCPNDWEWFAEIFRLFVTNSDLLREVLPQTYKHLRELYKPVVDAPWAEVLRGAPARTLAQAAKKAGG